MLQRKVVSHSKIWWMEEKGSLEHYTFQLLDQSTSNTRVSVKLSSCQMKMEHRTKTCAKYDFG